MKKLLGALIVASCVVPAAASAQGVPIFALETAARVAPSDGGAAIELANAYWRAGRTTDAAAVYRRALTLDNVMLETRAGDAIWSHEVARTVLARQTELTAR